MTPDSDDLRGRLDELEDAVDDRTAGDDRLTKRERKAIRAALQHRYTAGPDLAGDPFGDYSFRTPPITSTTRTLRYYGSCVRLGRVINDARPSGPTADADTPANLAGCCGRIAVGIAENSRKGRVTRVW